MSQRMWRILTLTLCGFLVACSRESEDLVLQVTQTLAPKRATSKPYQINGIWYYPQPHYEYDEEGIASYYGGGDVFHGRPTATGEIFDMNGLTAAHKTLPLPCMVEVTNLENGRQINIKVNDRGPFVDKRIIDVSRRVAQLLGFERRGTARVRVRTLVLESLALNSLCRPQIRVAEALPTPPSPSEDAKTTLVVSAGEPSITKEKVTPPSRPQDVIDTGIFVDVGGYQSHGEAKKMSKTLKELADSHLETIERKGQTPYVVRVGPLTNMSTANQLMDKLGEAGHKARLVLHP